MTVIYGILNVVMVYSIIQSILHVAVYKHIVRFPSKEFKGFVWKHAMRRSYLVSKMVSVLGGLLCLVVYSTILGGTPSSIPNVTGILLLLNYAGLLLSNYTCPKI